MRVSFFASKIGWMICLALFSAQVRAQEPHDASDGASTVGAKSMLRSTPSEDAAISALASDSRPSHDYAFAAATPSRPSDKTRALALLSSLPATFEANRGQADPSVRFLSRGPGYSLFLTQSGAFVSVPLPSDSSSRHEDVNRFSVLELRFAGANHHSSIEGLMLQASRSNYFLGNRAEDQHAGVPNYGQVRYAAVYPGIDLVFHGDPSRLEFDLTLAPGADPGRIRFRLKGAKKVALDTGGDLIATVGAKELRLHHPAAFQRTDSGEQAVEAAFVVSSRDEISFRLGTYNPALPLTIDPVLTYASFLGGSGADTAFAVALDPQHNFYVAGQTASTNFPVSAGVQGTFGGATDAFVLKIKADGSGLAYSTFLGGSLTDAGQALAVDSQGNAYVAGYTNSLNFPTVNALQPALAGGQDVFVSKLGPDGSSLFFSTYLGGSGLDTIAAIALDASNNVVLAGTTKSQDFPVVNALEPTLTGTAGNSDAFVAKLKADGSALLFSTYFGGTGVDGATGVAVSSAGNIWVDGGTGSTDFPVVNALQSTFGGGGVTNVSPGDAFLAEFKSDGSALVFSTYWGGSGQEQATSVSLDANDNVFLVGITSSTDFPTHNALQPQLASAAGFNGFVTKFAADGSSAPFSTYFGGSGSELVFGSATDASGNIFISGSTSSTNLPLVDPIQSSNLGGSTDGFIAELAANGSTLLFSTYLGGTGTDSFNRMAVDTSGVYVVGSTDSADFPVTGSPISQYMGGGDGVVVVISTSSGGAPSASLSPTSLTFPSEPAGTTSAAQQVTLSNAGTAPLTLHSFVINGDFSFTDNCQATLAPSASCTFGVTFKPTATGTRTGTLTINDDASDSPQQVSLTGTGTAGAAVASVAPTGLTFSTQLVSTTSAPQQVTLSNTGTAALAISSVAASGDFTFTDNCGASVAANSSCTFSITFKPTAGGTRTGSLIIADNATGSPQTVTLTGSGGDFTLAPVSGATLSATVKRGQTATYNLSVAPTGGLGGTISFSCSGAPPESACTVSPESLTTNGTTVTNFSVTVPTTAPSAMLPLALRRLPGDPARPTPAPLTLLGFGLALISSVTLAFSASWLSRMQKAIRDSRVHPARRALALATSAALLLALVTATVSLGGCTSGSLNTPPDPGTPVGTDSLVVTATFTSGASSLKHTLALTLNVQ